MDTFLIRLSIGCTTYVNIPNPLLEGLSEYSKQVVTMTLKTQNFLDGKLQFPATIQLAYYSEPYWYVSYSVTTPNANNNIDTIRRDNDAQYLSVTHVFRRSARFPSSNKKIMFSCLFKPTNQL